MPLLLVPHSTLIATIGVLLTVEPVQLLFLPVQLPPLPAQLPDDLEAFHPSLVCRSAISQLALLAPALTIHS